MLCSSRRWLSHLRCYTKRWCWLCWHVHSRLRYDRYPTTPQPQCPQLTFLGLYPISTLAVTWIATNLSPDSKRAIGMPLAYSIANVSNVVSSQLYPSQQGPRYIQGNAVSAGLTVVAAFLYASCWFLLRRRNGKKAKFLAEGATTNGLEGDQSLDSMYIL